MASIEWKESYSVGIPELDDQHKVLIRLIKLLEEESGTASVNHVLGELEHYVREHFHNEEAMLVAASYAAFGPHHEQHEAFKDWLLSVERVFRSGDGAAAEVAGPVNAYLKTWLINHILVSDMAYKDCLVGDK